MRTLTARLRRFDQLGIALAGLWIFLLATCIVVGFLVRDLAQSGSNARVAEVEARLHRASVSLQTRFGVYLQSYGVVPDFTDTQRRRELEIVLGLVLGDYPEVEGGFYQPGHGVIAYAYPSYEGSSPKHDVPEAELPRIQALAETAITARGARTEQVSGARQTLLLEAAPAGDAAPGLAVWVMSRAHLQSSDVAGRLVRALAVLGAFVVLSGVLLSIVLWRWLRGMRALADSIQSASLEPAPAPIPSGHRDFDRVAVAVGQLRGRLAAHHVETVRLGSELARAQRVASIGRMSAQLLHELRNPMAAIRLRAENALATEPAADGPARILADVDRIDDLLQRMEALTRLHTLHVTPVALDAWIDACIGRIAASATAKGTRVHREGSAGTWPLDANQLARVLDNLLGNAVRHAPATDGDVTVVVQVEPARSCRIRVVDNGPGLDPAAAAQVFEAFYTTRPDGTGLGLSIAREIVEAHGGTLTARANPGGGGEFIIELPWPAS